MTERLSIQITLAQPNPTVGVSVCEDVWNETTVGCVRRYDAVRDG